MDDLTRFYAALGTLGAAVVAALFGTLRLIGEKETKVSEFRQEWIRTIRISIAEFVASTHTICGRIAIRDKNTKVSNTMPAKRRGLSARLLNFIWQPPVGTKEANSANSLSLNDSKLESELLPHWANLRLSYNTVVLHLNPQEQKLSQAVMQFLKSLETSTLNNKKQDSEKGGEKEAISVEDNRKEHYKKSLELAEKILDQDFSLSIKTQTKISILDFQQRELRKNGNKEIQEKYKSLSLEKMPNEVNKFSSADALLLAMLITENLLQGTYENLNGRRSLIEEALGVVDRAGAIVIKKVWEQIKIGEFRYRLFIYLSSIISILGIFIVLFVLMKSKFGQQLLLSFSFF